MGVSGLILSLLPAGGVCVFVCMKLCEVENISLLVQTPMETAQHSYFAKNMPPKPCTFVSKNSSTLSPQLNSVIHKEKDNSHTAAEYHMNPQPQATVQTLQLEFYEAKTMDFARIIRQWPKSDSCAPALFSKSTRVNHRGYM